MAEYQMAIKNDPQWAQWCRALAEDDRSTMEEIEAQWRIDAGRKERMAEKEARE